MPDGYILFLLCCLFFNGCRSFVYFCLCFSIIWDPRCLWFSCLSVSHNSLSFKSIFLMSLLRSCFCHSCLYVSNIFLFLFAHYLCRLSVSNLSYPGIYAYSCLSVYSICPFVSLSFMSLSDFLSFLLLSLSGPHVDLLRL